MFDINNLEKLRIGLNDTFSFRCLECGQCCRHRDDIMLSPYDLFRIARELQQSTEQIIKEYCDCYIGHSSRLPIVRLASISSDNRCPFLKKGKCMVHKVKPVVCALFPLGRAYNPIKNETTYILQKAECGAKDKTQTVQEWINAFGIPEFDAETKSWHEAGIYFALIINELEEKYPPEILEPIRNGVGNLFYIKYDTQKPFLPQFEENITTLKEAIKDIQSILKGASA